MAQSLDIFRKILRFMLDDQVDPETGVCQFTDDDLDDLITCIFQIGGAPCCYSLDEDGCITPSPTPDAIGYLAVTAALFARGGMMACSYRTRAISVSQSAGSFRDARNFLIYQQQHLASRGNVCSSPSCSCGLGGGGDACFSAVGDIVNLCNAHKIALCCQKPEGGWKAQD